MVEIDRYFWVRDRTKHALQKAGAWNIKSVFSLSEDQLLKIPGVGKKGAYDIIDERIKLTGAEYERDFARRQVEKAKANLAPFLEKLEVAKKRLKEAEYAVSALEEMRTRLNADREPIA